MSEPDTKRSPPKVRGVKRGGKRIPRYGLEDALAWSDKLVSKTYNSAQPLDLIKASVVEAKSGVGDVKVSALRQYGLLEGNSAGLTATPLAREIKSAAPEARQELIRRAALRPEAFKALYETFQGDDVTMARLRQRAAEIGVHPDTAEECAELYSKTIVFAGLATRDGDEIRHAEASAASSTAEDLEQLEDESAEDGGDRGDGGANQRAEPDPEPLRSNPRRGAATVQVNINVDSSLDTEKLEKQLDLLRRYGAL